MSEWDKRWEEYRQTQVEWDGHLRKIVEGHIEKGEFRLAFDGMWTDGMKSVKGLKRKMCISCGNDEFHNEYWQFFDDDDVLITDPLDFADGERRRNPMVADCWRLDLTDEHQLQKKAYA